MGARLLFLKAKEMFSGKVIFLLEELQYFQTLDTKLKGNSSCFSQWLSLMLEPSLAASKDYLKNGTGLWSGDNNSTG